MSQPLASPSQEFIPLAALPFVDVEDLNVGAIALQLECPGLSPGGHPGNPWHPKVTGYRLMLVLITLGLGTAKAFSNGSVSVTIEWISGVVFLLLAFFLTDYESNESPKPHWFFKADVMNGVKAVFQRVGTSIPEHDTEECKREPLGLRLKHPPVTGYRIMVTAAAISFGMMKAGLSYCRGLSSQTAPTAVEWMYGVLVTVALYILGLYEMSPNKCIDKPWLFTTDYLSQITYSGKTLAHLTSLTAVYWLTLFCYTVILEALKSQTLAEPDNPQLSAYDVFFQRVIGYASLFGPVCLLAGGIVIGCVNIIWLGRALGLVFLKAVHFLRRSTIMRRPASWINKLSMMLRRVDWIARHIRRIRGCLCYPVETSWFSVIRAIVSPRIGWTLLRALFHIIVLMMTLGMALLWFLALPKFWRELFNPEGIWFMRVLWLPLIVCMSLSLIVGLFFVILFTVESCSRLNPRFLFRESEGSQFRELVEYSQAEESPAAEAAQLEELEGSQFSHER